MIGFVEIFTEVRTLSPESRRYESRLHVKKAENGEGKLASRYHTSIV